MDQTLKDSYWNFYTEILSNPEITVKMLIPEATYFEYNHEPVKIETKEFSGYFIAYKLENYIDAQTPVKVRLVRVR